MAVDAAEKYGFAQLELFEQRYIVEYRTVGPIGEIPLRIAVVDKLHGVETRERFKLYEVGQIGVGDEQIGVG